jgi:hypothetical protein
MTSQQLFMLSQKCSSLMVCVSGCCWCPSVDTMVGNPNYTVLPLSVQDIFSHIFLSNY